MENLKFYYTLRVMAASPHPETVTVSFTLPKVMSEAVERMARANLTNKSDIILRALLAFLPEAEAEEIRREITAHSERSTIPPLKVLDAKVAEDVVEYKVTKNGGKK